MSLISETEAAVKRAGVALSLRKTTAGTFDADTGAYTAAATETDYEFTGYLDRIDERLVNGTSIRSGDYHCWGVGFPSGVTPNSGDILVYSSRLYRIVEVEAIRYGTATLVHRMQIRGV